MTLKELFSMAAIITALSLALFCIIIAMMGVYHCIMLFGTWLLK